MTLLIFSFNRALQLQTLLKSLVACLHVEGGYEVHVLYAASDDTYQQGYEQVQLNYPYIQFHREDQQRSWARPGITGYWKNLYRYLTHSDLRRTSNFKALTEKIIAESRHEGILFLTDDSLFTRPVYLDNARLDAVLTDAEYRTVYSLRHGLTLQPTPPDINIHVSGAYYWCVTTEKTWGHWTWRFSVDGHLYNRHALLPILQRLNYANPNSLEGFVNAYISHVRPAMFSNLLFEKTPSLVGFILNKVQTYNRNQSFDVAPELLNQRLLAGYSLTYQYAEPVTDFQPNLRTVALTNAATGATEVIAV
jgi:hypothetical protein